MNDDREDFTHRNRERTLARDLHLHNLGRREGQEMQRTGHEKHLQQTRRLGFGHHER